MNKYKLILLILAIVVLIGMVAYMNTAVSYTGGSMIDKIMFSSS